VLETQSVTHSFVLAHSL